MKKGKNSGPFKIFFCSIDGATETKALGEYSMANTNQIVFKKWHFKKQECESAHGNKLKYQLSTSNTEFKKAHWID